MELTIVLSATKRLPTAESYGVLSIVILFFSLLHLRLSSSFVLSVVSLRDLYGLSYLMSSSMGVGISDFLGVCTSSAPPFTRLGAPHIRSTAPLNFNSLKAVLLVANVVCR